MTYTQTLDYLYDQLPMYQRQGAPAMKMDLRNIRALLAGLGNPEKQLNALHVGGTNGKGSVTHLLGAALMAEGKRVGFYTSPHYLDFRERIKINGQLVPEQWVTDFVADHRRLIEEVGPSFFEITVAMAFQYFAAQRVDWAVIEVGLGGRLDSTNVIDPQLSVITNISLDHTRFLGDTLAQIASEKAGIIKAGRPVVIGKSMEETEPVFRQKAWQCGSSILFADRLWEVDKQLDHGHYTDYTISQSGLDFRLQLPVQLAGPYQAENVVTALTALHELRALGLIKLNYDALARAWARLGDLTYFVGRWQQIGEHPLQLVDSAHNEGGIKSVMGRLQSIASGDIHMVVGFVNDKDLSSILPLLPDHAIYYWVQADIPRALDANELRTAAGRYGLRGEAYPSVADGWYAARQVAHAGDLLYGGGSVFVVSEILATLD